MIEQCVRDQDVWKAPDCPGLYFFRIEGTREMSLELRVLQARWEQEMHLFSARDKLSDRLYQVSVSRQEVPQLCFNDEETKSVLAKLKPKWLYIGESLSLKSRIGQHSRNLARVEQDVMDGRDLIGGELESARGGEEGWRKTVQFYQIVYSLYRAAYRVKKHKLLPYVSCEYLAMPNAVKSGLQRVESNLIEIYSPIGNFKS